MKIKIVPMNVRQCKRLLAGAIFMAVLTGCATTQPSVVGYGETVAFDFTCRTDDGAIVVTTQKETVFDKGANVSNAFVPLEKYTPALVTVGAEVPQLSNQMPHPLIDEVSNRIAMQLEGSLYSRTRHVRVAAEAINDLPEHERILQFARTMQRPKHKRIPKAQFIKNTGKEPELGEMLFTESAVQWKVTAIGDDSVEVQYMAQDGMTLTLPYGKAVVKEQRDHYDLEISAVEGNLVRIGPYVGRISEVGDRLFTVDFSHPFGGRTLDCAVTPMEANTKAPKGRKS